MHIQDIDPEAYEEAEDTPAWQADMMRIREEFAVHGQLPMRPSMFLAMLNNPGANDVDTLVLDIITHDGVLV